jgi:nucleoside-diphosphate-sugar epimerase
MTRALVTGGAGFIGHHLVRGLLDDGLEVTVLDNLSTGRRDLVPAAARFVEGDVRDARNVSAAVEGADCVIHLAARVSIRASVDAFIEDAAVNLMGTLSLLDALARSDVRHAVFASSMAVYAELDEPLREDAPVVPSSPYGIAKLAAERYWVLLLARAGIDATVLRYFNTYGPGQTPTPYVGVITTFVDTLLRGEPPVVFGDGEQRRDFIHVDDVVRATKASLGPRAAGRVFNVGTGHGTSVNELATRLIAKLRPGLTPVHRPARPEEVRNAVADIAAISGALGFAPAKTEIDFDSVIARLSRPPG